MAGGAYQVALVLPVGAVEHHYDLSASKLPESLFYRIISVIFHIQNPFSSRNSNVSPPFTPSAAAGAESSLST